MLVLGVVIQHEANLVAIELDRAIDITHRENNDFEGPIHVQVLQVDVLSALSLVSHSLDPAGIKNSSPEAGEPAGRDRLFGHRAVAHP
jgi:hypothetical protein